MQRSTCISYACQRSPWLAEQRFLQLASAPKKLYAFLDLFKIHIDAMYEQTSWGLDMKEKKDELLTHANARYLIATHVHIQVHVPQRGREKRMPS